MATKSLGTLTLDLIAKIGGFTGPMDQASRQAKSSMNQIKVSTVAAGVALGELAAKAISAVPSAMEKLITGAAESAQEITNLSRIAGLSTTDFQRLAAGAATVGVSSEKLSDMLKDVGDKVGDFLNTGGGQMQDFFTNIAPKVGVTADQFRKLNSAQALQLYVSSLEKANASQSEMTFYMEAIANDATGLLPLLRNNGSAWKELGDQAQAAGIVLGGDTIAAGQQFNAELVKLSQYLDAAKVSMAAEFLPVVVQFGRDAQAAAKEAGGLAEVTKKAGAAIVETGAYVANVGDGVARVFNIVANTLVGTYATAVGHTKNLGAEVTKGLSLITFGDTSEKLKAQAAEYSQSAVENFSIAGQAADAIKDDLEAPLAGDAFKKYIEDAKAAAAEYQRLFGDTGTTGTGTGVDGTANKKAQEAAKAAAAAQKKLNDQVNDTGTEYQRQIALINTSTDAQKDATETDKLRFEIASGKLVGINAEQQKRLLLLAEELDKLEKVKKANEDQAKVASYVATLQQNNATAKNGLDMDLAGIGLGDKARDRLKQDLQIQQEFNQQMADLQEQYNTKQISPELYAKESRELQDSLDERMAAQKDYYKKQDAAQSDWVAGISDAWNNYKDQAADSASQTKDLFSDALSGTEDAIVDFVKTGKLSFKDMADSIIEDLIRIQVRQAAVGLLGSAFSFLTGGSAALGSSVMTGSSSGSLVANAKGGVYDSPSLSAFSNQIHDSPQMFAFAKGAGIFAEAGPEAIMPLTRSADGSLGVRAIGTRDAAVAQAATDSTASIGGITQHISVQGSADDATLARIAQASKKGAEDGYALVISDLKRNGPVRQLLNRR
ncbi:phage tail tape measure protein [Pseudomonas typographi]|uniref:phage tail tape measure protein n=1 Tax=Pseudomonas typographi TaxID=2715964 RepID=UPI00168764D7|nr:phage tail tape measure protein [Pseudomonas typographi]MBD1589672.1 phage tail tape measure protein [Pseudomonas typographi]